MSIHKRRTKRGVVYDVRWREGQSNKGRTFTDRKDAVAFEAEQQRRQRLGAHAPAEPSGMSLSNFLEHWFTTSGPGWEGTTRRTRAHLADRWIDPYLGDEPLRNIGRARVREFRAAIIRAGSPPTNTNNTMRVLSAALGVAVDEGLIPANPCYRLGRVRVNEPKRRALPGEVFTAMMQAVRRPQEQVLIAIGYWAGLRPAELVALTWGQVHLDVLTVMGSVQEGADRPTKTTRRRVVPIEPELRRILDGAVPPRVGPDDPICPAARGGYIDWHNWTTRVWNPARKMLGTDVIPMEMRHSCASRWLREGHDVISVAAWLGHDPAVTLAHYAHFLPRAPGQVVRTAPQAPAA